MTLEEVSSEEQETTPSPEESDSQPESEGAEKQEASPEKPKEEPQVPFHEHPRFKELIEERRAYKEQLDQTKGYVEAMQRELHAERAARQVKPTVSNEPKYKALLEQVRAVNPEFAQLQEELMSSLEEAKKEASNSKKALDRLDAYEQREFQNAAISKLSTLMESNKIPDPMRKRYDREVRAMAYEEEMQGKKLSLADVDRLFKAVHEEYAPFVESIKRESLKGYVKEKKSDTAPAGATGGTAAVAGTGKFKADDQESLVKWMAKELRASKKV